MFVLKRVIFAKLKKLEKNNNRGESAADFIEITSNGTTYNSENTTETTGGNLFIPTGVNASVRLLTLPEMNKMLGRTDIDSTDSITDPTGMDGIFVLENIKNLTGMSAYTDGGGFYWLASVYPTTESATEVCQIGNYYSVNNISFYNTGYFRPVISLLSDIQFTDTNGDGVLELAW